MEVDTNSILNHYSTYSIGWQSSFMVVALPNTSTKLPVLLQSLPYSCSSWIKTYVFFFFFLIFYDKHVFFQY